MGRALHAMIEHPLRVVGVLALISAALVVVGISLAPDEDASFSPGGEEFATGELVEREFRPSTTELQFIVEDEDADALDLATLLEWKQNSDALRTSNDLADEMSTYFDDGLGITVNGIYSIADAADEELRTDGIADGLESATEDQVKQAVSAVLAEDRPTVVFRDQLSVFAEVAESDVGGSPIEVWTSPAFLTSVRVDHSAFPIALEGETDPETRTDAQQDDIDAERDLDIEEWARDAQDVLRGDEQDFQAWGVAIDNGLTSDESFQSTIPFLVGAIVLIMLLVGVLLRSYWAAALAGIGLALTLLWARMINNIAGFDESIILDVIVPIATISFGVDFMIHAVGRCREELAGGKQHRSAYVIGIATVGGALVLALSTSAIAFGSNATSGIPGVIQFGFGAAISLGAAFVMLGLFAPLFLLRIEEALADAPPPGRSPLARITSGFRILVASVLAAIAIIAIIAVPFVGAVATVLYGALVIALPLWWTTRSVRRPAGGVGVSAATPNTAGQSMALAGRAVSAIVRYRYVALALIAVTTVVAVIGATNVGTKTEPNDFYPSSSDFVVGIDKVLEHSSTVSPGDVLIYVEGTDLADPRVLRVAEETVETVGAEGGDLFVQNPDGSFAAPDSAVDLARAAVGIDYARQAIAAETGVPLSDDDGDGFPDAAEQVDSVFTYALANGIPADDAVFVYTPDEVATLLSERDDAWATVLSFPMQGFGDSARVRAARDVVEAGEADLLAATREEGLTIETSISGSILTEQLALDAITDSMLISVPLAMVLCLIVAGFVMRSPRLSLASIIPIALVIAWLLGFMYAFDFDINIVTATIAAISVGVGIDYSIHFTMRFREELAIAGDRLEAVRRAADGTGTALILSGGTSVIGFLLLALAPMPIFAAYGLLTAVMIALSLLASLTVLPSLLYLLAPAGAATRETVPSHGESSASS